MPVLPGNSGVTVDDVLGELVRSTVTIDPGTISCACEVPMRSGDNAMNASNFFISALPVLMNTTRRQRASADSSHLS
jgi:hypothetical protein